MKLSNAWIGVSVFLLVGIVGCSGSGSAGGTTINASDCSAGTVQAALNSAASGDIVAIPKGTCTWTTQVSWTAPANVTLQGAGNSSVGGGDQTIIVDSYASNNALLAITTNSSGTFRLSGVTFEGGSTGSGNDKYDGMVRISGSSSSIRVDHVHMLSTTYNPPTNGSLLEFTNACEYGVVDHSQFDNRANSVNNSIRVFNQSNCNSDALGTGDQAFAAPTGLGSAKFIFAEDNVFNSGASNDCFDGGSFVWRHNTFNMTAPAPAIQTHPTAGTRRRGCRAWEIYSNTFNADSGNYIAAVFFVSAATGVIWGNTIPSSSAGGGTGYGNVVTGHDMRYSNSTYPETATPNGWGYCGTHQTGLSSGWDQNTDSSGYACLDQLGRGQGQLLVLDFPNAKNNVTGTIAWPNQALEPIYEWLDAYSPVPNNPSHIWSQYDPLAEQNRDYYLGTADSGSPITFNGTAGVGQGLLSARPSTCTRLVAYWATDTTTLYQCSSTNTWTSYYTPYTYPHPLVSQLSAPTNLRVE